MAQYAQTCPNLRVKGHDDQCHICCGKNLYTGNGSASFGGPPKRDYIPGLNPEDLSGMHIVDGATGRKRGRPQKPFDELTRTGKIERLRATQNEEESDYWYGYEPSTPADWARERAERVEAVWNCKLAGLSLGPDCQK